MYSNPTQLSQLQPQQKPQHTQQSQQQQQQQQQQNQSKGEIRSALSQSISMLSTQQHTDSKQPILSTLAPLAPSLSQAGQILNLGGGNNSVGGQILNIPNGAAGAGGQNFYVMIPQNQLDSASQLQKIAPMGNVHQSTGDTLSQQRSDREEKRRQTHNEVERRRRGKINGWIQKLAEMVPSCKEEMGSKRAAPGTGMKSNCGVLQKTVNFIQELQIAHAQVVERLQEQNQVLGEMAKVRESLKRVEQENLLLRSQLQTHGIEPLDYSKQPQVTRPNI